MCEENWVPQLCIFSSKTPALTQDKLFQEIVSNNLNDGSSENKLHCAILQDDPTFTVGNKPCSWSVCNRAYTRTISWVFSNGAPTALPLETLSLHSGAAVMFYSFTYLLGGYHFELSSALQNSLFHIFYLDKIPWSAVSMKHPMQDPLPSVAIQLSSECFPPGY